MFEMTFPDDVKEFVMKCYDESLEILEYGSGGSTIYAVLAGKRITTVESDLIWLNNLKQEINEHKNFSALHADIGKTKEWGHPVDSSGYRISPNMLFCLG